MAVHITNIKDVQRFQEDGVTADATFDNSAQTITVKDTNALDFKIEAWTKAKLDHYIAVLQAVSTAAATEFD